VWRHLARPRRADRDLPVALTYDRGTEGLAHTDSGQGRPVVLLHGLTCHLGYWLRVTPLLTGVRVIALDFRGHGLSEHADSYGYTAYEQDLTSLLDRLELDDVTVAGHSLGGYVALLAASRDERIRRVLAIDVKSDWTEEDAAFAVRSRGATQRVEPEREVLVGRLAKSVAPSALDPDELELLAERSIERAEGGWQFRWDRRVLATDPVDPYAFLGRVRGPTHVIAGSESDVMPPDKAHRFADAIPGGTVEIVEGAGHHVELDVPELVAERILG
jgi:pimeloyl-ACP methyl ester carboxylesterase